MTCGTGQTETLRGMGITPRPESRVPSPGRSAFTLAELMVSVAILVVAMLAVGYIFSSVTKTSGITTATIELTDAADVLQKTMQRDLDVLLPGGMMIRAIVPGINLKDLPIEPVVPQTRSDGLLFFASGSPGQFQSFWNPQAVSSDAIIFYAHGGDEMPNGDLALPLSLFDRILCRRAILLVSESYAPGDPNWGNGACGPPLNDANYLPPSTLGRAPWNDASAFNQLNTRLMYSRVDVIQGHTASDLITRLRGPLAGYASFIMHNYAPRRLPEDLNRLYDRGRSCFNLMPHVGEVIVEWTAGSGVDPRPSTYDGRLQWFGLGRDVAGDGVIRSTLALHNQSTLPVTDVMSRTAYSLKFTLPVLAIEQTRDDGPTAVRYGSSISPNSAGYLAVWSERTWQYRPKAIRVIVRLYDSNKRIRDDDNRLGREYSFVLQVP